MILVDTAAVEIIRAALENRAICGFTTNPKLIAEAAGEQVISARAYRVFCEKLCMFAGADRRIRHLMIQTIGTEAQNRDLAVACRQQLGVRGAVSSTVDLWIKLPPTPEDLRCVDALRREGCKSLVTAVFTPSQALMAMESGADGVAVYFGRLLKHCADWQRQLSTIVEIVRERKALLLLASLSEPELVAQSLAFSHDLTIPPALVAKLMDSTLSLAAMEEFAKRVQPDWGETGFTVVN
jgi:transaldolase